MIKEVTATIQARGLCPIYREDTTNSVTLRPLMGEAIKQVSEVSVPAS